jgi:hypothetical protein
MTRIINPYRDAEQATIGMLPDPSQWVNWPVMPVKHTRNRDKNCPQMPQTGYIVAQTFNNPAPFVVHEGNIFTMDWQNDPIVGTYQTVYGLLDAGWIID